MTHSVGADPVDGHFGAAGLAAVYNVAVQLLVALHACQFHHATVAVAIAVDEDAIDEGAGDMRCGGILGMLCKALGTGVERPELGFSLARAAARSLRSSVERTRRVSSLAMNMRWPFQDIALLGYSGQFPLQATDLGIFLRVTG